MKITASKIKLASVARHLSRVVSGAPPPRSIAQTQRAGMPAPRSTAGMPAPRSTAGTPAPRSTAGTPAPRSTAGKQPSLDEVGRANIVRRRLLRRLRPRAWQVFMTPPVAALGYAATGSSDLPISLTPRTPPSDIVTDTYGRRGKPAFNRFARVDPGDMYPVPAQRTFGKEVIPESPFSNVQDRVAYYVHGHDSAGKPSIWLGKQVANPVTYAHEYTHYVDPALHGRTRSNDDKNLYPYEVEIPAMTTEVNFARQRLGVPDSYFTDAGDTEYGDWIYDHMDKYGPNFRQNAERHGDQFLADDKREVIRWMREEFRNPDSELFRRYVDWLRVSAEQRGDYTDRPEALDGMSLTLLEAILRGRSGVGKREL